MQYDNTNLFLNYFNEHICIEKSVMSITYEEFPMQSLSTHHQGISLFVHLLLNHQVPKTFWQVKAVPKEKMVLFKIS